MEVNRISVIIPSYRNPTFLDLCLRSLFENQKNDNQIIAVLDGFGEESYEVIKKYPNLNVLEFEENKGQTYAHNNGVIAAENEAILIINDDNVAPSNWDERLLEIYKPDHVIAPNQIEPTPSIFSSFDIKSFGETPDKFRYEDFLDYEKPLSSLPPQLADDGGTWPVFMNKKWYQALGGIDPYFPSPAVADHDFFLRCELAGLKMQRFLGIHFYHFAGASTKKVVKDWNVGEMNSHEYFKYKWGFYSRFGENNSHKPDEPIVRGVRFK